MTNPITVSRSFLWSKLSGDSTLMTLVDNRIFPTRPPQGSHFPLVYFEHILTTTLSSINGLYLPFAKTLWRIHVVGDRDANDIDIDPIVTEVITALNSNRFTILGDGNQASGAIDPSAPIPLPYDIEADQYPRNIVPYWIWVSFN